MKQDSKIYVAGHNGLVGSAIYRMLQRKGFQKIITRTRSDLELLDTDSVKKFFKEVKPKYVFLAAAKVGGIYANNAYPADFIRENLVVQTNIIHESWKIGVKKLLFLGSSCIYPKLCPQPIKEEYLLSGQLEPTNDAYAIAKIAGIKTCQSYNKQFGTRFISVMPTNLYGENDNFHPINSHVLPALIRKFHEAKEKKIESVSVWGSGRARREFLYSDDLAEGLFYLMESYQDNEVINIGYGQDQTILELANIVKEVVGFNGKLNFDKTLPDGTPQKILDSSKIFSLGWTPKITLTEGIEKAYKWFKKNCI